VTAATDFETRLEDIGQKIGIPVDGLQTLGAELRAVAKQTTQSAAAIAEGMDVLAGMGASRADAMGLLPPIGKAATAYRADVTDLAKAGYAALDNLKVPAAEFAKALDAMAQAGKAGAFELRDMAQYFPTLGAGYQALKQTGVPAVADLAAALQIVRKGAGNSAEAATNLSDILQKINSPLTRKNFAKMGVDLEKEMAKLAEAGMTPIEAIAVLTNKTLKGNLGRLGDLFQDAQVQKGLRPLIQNIEEYRRIRKEALAAQGVVEEDYQRRLKTGASALMRFRIAIEAINLAVGSALLPGLTSLADVVVPLTDKIAAFAEAHPALTRAVIATATALIGLRIAGIAAKFGLLWMWGGALTVAKAGLIGLSVAGRVAAVAFLPFGAALRAARTAMIGFAATSAILGTGGALRLAGASLLGMLNPLRLVTAAFHMLKLAVIGTGIGAILVAIAAAGVFIYNNWSGIKALFAGIGEGFMAAFQPLMPVLQPVVDLFARVMSVFTDMLGPLDASNESWRALGVTIGTSIGGAITGAIEKIKSLIGWVVSVPGKIKGLLGFGDGAAAGAAPPATTGAIKGARAAGGPVIKGMNYLVGERGPELFRAPASGGISSAADTVRALKQQALAGAARHGAAGGTVNNINVGGIHVQAAPGQSAEAIADAVERKFNDKLAALSRAAYSDGVN